MVLPLQRLPHFCVFGPVVGPDGWCSRCSTGLISNLSVLQHGFPAAPFTQPCKSLLCYVPLVCDYMFWFATLWYATLGYAVP
eukprot:8392413-Pyramimonas_sp.AAC.1